jgi:hypothetical protein
MKRCNNILVNTKSKKEISRRRCKIPQELNLVNVHKDFNTTRSLSWWVVGL